MHLRDVFKFTTSYVQYDERNLKMKKLLNKIFKSKKKGFTLIEMVIVIAIVVMLLIIIAPNLVHQKENAQRNTDKAFVTTLQTQVELYNDEHKDKKLTNDLSPLKSESNYLTEKQKNELNKYELHNGKVPLKDEKM